MNNHAVRSYIHMKKGVRKYVIIRGTGIYKEFCGFPKGHMELGETETETVLREVKEETGLVEIYSFSKYSIVATRGKNKKIE